MRQSIQAGTSTHIEPKFLETGYDNWKDALVKKRGFAAHEQSDCHKKSVEKTITLPETTEGVGELLDTLHASEKAIARQALLKILSNVRFLARQVLPIRGYGKEEVNSNFNQLYYLRGEDKPFMTEWAKRKGSNFMHHDMKVMALKILRDIAAEIRSVEFFTIMVDEATDVSNVSQLVLYMRWVDNELNPHEDFIGLHELEDVNANTIVHVIKDVLLRMNISLAKCYDGCSTMTGEKGGVAKQIKDIEKKALLTHCYTHSLNLAVGDAIKNSKIMRDALEITKLRKKAPKRDSKLDSIKKVSKTESEEDDSVKSERVMLLCPSRWTVRAKSLGSILNNFGYLRELWGWSVQNCSDTDMKARIRGVDA